MVHAQVQCVLEIFSKLIESVGGTLYLKGGALRNILLEEDTVIPNDIDLQVETENVSLFLKLLDILIASGTLKRIPHGNSDLPYSVLHVDRFEMTLPQWEAPIQVDLIFDEPVPDTIAGMIRGKIIKGSLHSLTTANSTNILQSLHDAKSHIIRVNPMIRKEMKHKAMTRYHVWRRVLKYLRNGWTLDMDHPANKDLPQWLRENGMAKPSCGHVFDADTYLNHCISTTPLDDWNREPEKSAECPTCGVRDGS